MEEYLTSKEEKGQDEANGTCIFRICCANSYKPIYDPVGSDKDRLYVAVYGRGGAPRMVRHITAMPRQLTRMLRIDMSKLVHRYEVIWVLVSIRSKALL
jgi:hypothetical protein